MVFLIGVIEII